MKPQYELTRVRTTGAHEPPQLVPVTGMPWDTRMDRRSLFGVGAGAAGLLPLLRQDAHAQLPSSAGLVFAHQDLVTALVISPDGRYLFSGSRDYFPKFWSLPSGELLNPDIPAGSPVLFATASPDGRSVLVAYAPNIGRVAFPSGVGGNERATLDGGGSPGAAVFLPDSQGFIAGSSKGSIEFFSISPFGSGFLINRGLRLTGHSARINALALSADAKTLASASDDATVRLWVVPSGQPLATLTGHEGPVTQLVFAPTGTLISASSDGSLRLWSVPSGSPLRTLRREGAPAIDPLAPNIFRTPDAHSVAAIAWPTLRISSFAVTRDGRILSAVEGAGLQLWSPFGDLLEAFADGKSRFHGVALSPDGRTFACWTGGGNIELRSAADGSLAGTLEGNAGRVQTVAFTPDSRWLVSGHAGGAILMWDLDRREFRTFLYAARANRGDAVTYTLDGLTYASPCGAAIPPGAVCTCNCIAGAFTPPVSGPGGGGGGGGCTCNLVCTCVPVFR